MKSDFDVIWARITRVLSFLLGFGIGAYETLVDKSDRPYLLAFAAGLIGLPLARSIDSFLSKLNDATRSELPEEPERTERKPPAKRRR